MPWIRLEDNFPEHPKILALSDAAFRLHVRAIGYAARHLTDGCVRSAAFRSMTRRQSLATELIAAGIWEATDDGFHIHDYLAYQPSRTEVEERRAADRSRKKSDGIRSGSARNPRGIR